jgi:hypothetical protein
MKSLNPDAPIASDGPWPKHSTYNQHQGPTYINALPRQPAIGSAKAMGVTAAFFGLVFMIGATAAILSGKLSLEIPFQAWRALVTFSMGGISLFLGVLLLRNARK